MNYDTRSTHIDLSRGRLQLVQSASVFKRSASVSTTVIINLQMWNMTWIKSGLLTRVFATNGVHRGRLSS
jgi:hypothetical protein